MNYLQKGLRFSGSVPQPFLQMVNAQGQGKWGKEVREISYYVHIISSFSVLR